MGNRTLIEGQRGRLLEGPIKHYIPLKIGDKVKCVKDDGRLKVGRVYTISKAPYNYCDPFQDSNEWCIELKELEPEDPYFISYFELVKSIKKVKPVIKLPKYDKKIL